MLLSVDDLSVRIGAVEPLRQAVRVISPKVSERSPGLDILARPNQFAIYRYRFTGTFTGFSQAGQNQFLIKRLHQRQNYGRSDQHAMANSPAFNTG